VSALTGQLLLALLFLCVAVYYFIRAKKEKRVKYVWAGVFFLGFGPLRFVPVLGIISIITGAIGYFLTRTRK